ncbi:transcriptional repressor [Synechococcus sp. R55.3]|jgi:Fur family ferric uptake transcriptional regulator|uniref:Fur family transcriptional regulator n=1 Tax=unclassified Synechococcus TaxID=2626047 RepID=UPI0039C1A355
MPRPLDSLEAALERCRECNLRLSRQRRYILELLWQCGEHLSAREIYDRLNQQGKPIGHTSVYQNLEALASHNIVECLDRADGRRYGNRTHPHSHVNCLDSNRILDVDVELPPELLAQVEQQTGTRIQSYRIEFFGVEKPAQSQP